MEEDSEIILVLIKILDDLIRTDYDKKIVKITISKLIKSSRLWVAILGTGHPCYQVAVRTGWMVIMNCQWVTSWVNAHLQKDDVECGIKIIF